MNNLNSSICIISIKIKSKNTEIRNNNFNICLNQVEIKKGMNLKK